jgi:hypothetical protein
MDENQWIFGEAASLISNGAMCKHHFYFLKFSWRCMPNPEEAPLRFCEIFWSAMRFWVALLWRNGRSAEAVAAASLCRGVR